uniref:Uncharacterized protein n=1 Tax=viral metagenome TaxID=1070528 RepID=A0A6M3LT55_9ZZZZ
MSNIPIALHKDIYEFIVKAAECSPWYCDCMGVYTCAGCDAHMPCDDEEDNPEQWLYDPCHHEHYCVYRQAYELRARLIKENVLSCPDFSCHTCPIKISCDEAQRLNAEPIKSVLQGEEALPIFSLDMNCDKYECRYCPYTIQCDEELAKAHYTRINSPWPEREDFDTPADKQTKETDNNRYILDHIELAIRS